MHNNNHNPSVLSSVSSGIWGEDINVRMNSEYTNFKELKTSGLFRLIVTTRFGRKVMLKTLKDDVKDNLKYKELLHKEFDILLSLHHESIVNVIAWENDINGFGACIVMEYIEGVTLNKYLLQNPTKKEKIILLNELLKVVEYVHNKQIIHRDIKPANIMVQSDGQHLKLIDFGLADSTAYEILKQPCGTEGYVAPEQLYGINDLRNDIYSLGCIIKDMHIGWSYDRIAKRCLTNLEDRPSSAKVLLRQLEKINIQKMVCWCVVATFVVILVVTTIWYAIYTSASKVRTQEMTSISNEAIAKDTIENEIINQPLTTTISYQDYREILAVAKKLINNDATSINTMIDTLSNINYLPPSFSDFLVQESTKINKFAESHRGDINPSEFNTFYEELMNYYKETTDKWMRKLDELNALQKP